MKNEETKGFKKVAQSGGSYITATLYNPTTKEVIVKCVRDYDYDDGSRDDDELYYAPIDEEALKMYRHDNGIICIGDNVVVVKGRTIEHGYIGEVISIKPYRDRYGRWLADYIYFKDGRKINVANCRLA